MSDSVAIVMQSDEVPDNEYIFHLPFGRGICALLICIITIFILVSGILIGISTCKN